MRYLALSLILLFFGACSVQRAASGGDHLPELAALMSGSFTSAEQAAADTNYFDISLRMYRIWPEQKDKYWLYVEQAVTAMQERPYRQRVYELV